MPGATDPPDDPLAALKALPESERRELCRRVVGELSELVEGTADPDLSARVDEILGRCRPYLSVRNTLELTIRELGHLPTTPPTTDPDPRATQDRLARCIDAVRRRLGDADGSTAG